MSHEFEENLQKYAEVIVKVGLNLQPGQRLLIGAPAFDSLVPLAAAPLVRLIVSQAYNVGARLVDVMWGDEQLQLIRIKNAPRDSLDEYPAWQSNTALEYAKHGEALLMVYAHDPDLLVNQNPDLIATMQQAGFKHNEPFMDHLVQNTMNWSMISVPVPGWSAKIFPDDSPKEQEKKLWETIFEICRVTQADPIAAWQNHADQLVTRTDYLNHRKYAALKLTAHATDLTIGLPDGHLWRSGRMTSKNGIAFIGNIPTEEVFTMPHKDKTEGSVTATRPLSYGGALIEDFSLTFSGGRIVRATAAKGEQSLLKLIETDDGAGRLGEVALVPNSSPISQTGLLFYNLLIDENAANHIALGRAYKFSMEKGEAMSDDAFAAHGGNHSLIHIDFMVGSGKMDVDGFTKGGTAEPLMRQGEWAFEVRG